ncbi:MAG TPA: HD-GYP domain-containing protein [Planctomycetota bacterium]|nr:HD-GYP domain-containing protein [Planctomycetota bacterium]
MTKTQQALKEKRILIVDPLGECLPLAKKLVSENYEKTILARSFEDLLRILTNARKDREPLDLLVLSLKLPECTALDGMKSLRKIYDGPLMLLAESADQRDIQMPQTAADDCFVQSLSPELFVLKVERLLIRRILRDQMGVSTYRSESLFLNILAVMAKVLEAKDPNTRFHSEKVSMLASNIAREMGFSEEEVKRVSIAGILHDIGKMGISEAILKKAGPLTLEEREIVERHPSDAAQMLGSLEMLKGAVSYIKHHHEHFDGSGYPDQLAGESIPLGARIIHVAEAFDSMVTQRSYSPALSPEEAMAELQQLSGVQFDPNVVDVLDQILSKTGLLLPSADMPAKSLPQLLEELGE